MRIVAAHTARDHKLLPSSAGRPPEMGHNRQTAEAGETGSSLLELALLLPVLLLLLLAGAVDFGQAYYVGIEVTSAAEAGTTYGALNLTDTAGMATAALLDAADVPSMTATATWGCECSDGTSVTTSCASKPACTVNLVDYVDVRTAATYSPILVYGVLPSSFALTGHSRMRVSP